MTFPVTGCVHLPQTPGLRLEKGQFLKEKVGFVSGRTKLFDEVATSSKSLHGLELMFYLISAVTGKGKCYSEVREFSIYCEFILIFKIIQQLSFENWVKTCLLSIHFQKLILLLNGRGFVKSHMYKPQI